MISRLLRIPTTELVAGRCRLVFAALRGREALLAAVVVAASAAAALGYVWSGCPLGLAPDEAHYWEWSRHLDWSYYSKGPLVAWIIRGADDLFGPLSVRVTGDLAAAVRTPAVLCHVALLAGMYVLAAGVWRSPRAGLLVVVAGASLPAMRAGAVLMTIDPPFLACWCWALVCVRKGLDGGRVGWWLGAGVCTALGILAKFTMTVFPAVVVGFLLFHRRVEFRRAGVWVLLAGAVAGWLPILAWNAEHEWVSFRHVFGQVGGSGKTGSVQWLGPVAFVVTQFGVLFGLWLMAFLAAAWHFRPTREPEPEVQLLWWCSVPVWGLFLVASAVKQGQPNWPAPAYIAGLVLAVGWVRETWHRAPRLMALGVGTMAVLGLLVSLMIHYPQLLRPTLAQFAGPPTRDNPLPIRQVDMTARLSGWKTLAAEVDRIRTQITARTGQEPVLAATHWTIPGQLSFYCEGHPTAYAVGIPNRSDRHSQYDLWHPNPVADAQDFRGRTFVIVGDIAAPMLAAFDRVEPPVLVTHSENGVPVAAWSVWVCHGFRGFAAAGLPHDPGY